MKKSLFIFLTICLVFLAFFVKGKPGSPLYYQKEKDPQVTGPFESSNSNSRYALTEVIVEKNSFSFSDEQARFSSPDLVKYQNVYFSIFTPGVSFIAVPFYFLGKLIGVPQLFTYFSTLIFALLNIFLIQKLSKKLGADQFLSYISAGIFMFATNAFPYALTLTQHHAASFVILLSLLLVTQKVTFWRNFWIGFLYVSGLLIDIPNLFMLLPVVLFGLSQHIDIKESLKNVTVSIKLAVSGLILGMIPLLLVFFAYNFNLTGSYIKIGQFIGQYNYPGAITTTQLIKGAKVNKGPSEFKLSLPFKTRLQLRSAYILFFSQQRSWWYYCPIILIGILGLINMAMTKEHRTFSLLAAAIILMNILIYSMFADPWGGWSFGPRYLIPSAALLAIFIAPVLKKFGQNIFFMIPFTLLLVYSLWINTIGALTTAAIPPLGEAEYLNLMVPYTWRYNLLLLTERNTSSSLIYNLFFLKQFPALNYASFMCCGLLLVFIVLYYLYLRTLRKTKIT